MKEKTKTQYTTQPAHRQIALFQTSVCVHACMHACFSLHSTFQYIGSLVKKINKCNDFTYIGNIFTTAIQTRNLVKPHGADKFMQD